ncbi:thioesterase family protein [Undibacterium sp. TS12]|uniref:acyl-CoA thioesterase n=1 Tax=Undibacterium sp. TS12 TaxID=2908202 RepID=UPI001F4C59CB|nr:thioesterase family protein [Undibacterium sp. TS12]MCH8618366.1 acyl-CoA thioesterase [Undibacterium sp. TS12]
MPKQDFSFLHRLRVRWSEVDMQAIVFNGNYLNYFDVAFTEYWRATGLPNVIAQAAEGKELFARKSTVEYMAPARFDDELDIAVRCASMGRSSLQFILEIYHGEMHLISGELVYVYADTEKRKSVAISEEWRAIITGFETLKPADARTDTRT